MDARSSKAGKGKRPLEKAAPAREGIPEEIERISTGYRNSILLLSANRLGIFDSLAGGPAPADVLARRLKLNRRALAITLDALAAMGLLNKRKGIYSCKPSLLPYLVTGGERYFGDLLNHHFNSLLNWMDLPKAVRHGGPARVGELKRSAKEHREFILAMSNLGRRYAEETLEYVDISRFKRMLDIGGGPGTFSIAFCKKNPGLSAVVFDLPQTIPIARDEIKRANMQHRIETAPGDFNMDPIGGGYDLVLISSILHSLSHTRTAALLGKVHRAMDPGGLLVIREFYLDETRTSPVHSAVFAVHMLISTDGGNCYTRSEITSAMRRSGFTGIKSRRTAMRWAVYTGRKPRM